MELLHQSGEIVAQRYRILDILGQGGIGTTYKAEDLQSGHQLALKALSLRRMTDWKKMELFEREANILAQLNHPAIPRYLNYFQIDTPEDRSFYIAQQLAPGKSLEALIESGWHPDEAEVRCLAIQLLEILVYLQSITPPIIHRDIKPQNLILHSSIAPLFKEGWGELFLVDFGAVQDTYHHTVTGGSTVVGTYGYMAPEQFRGQAVLSTDLYGLGTTLLFLLTGESPANLPHRQLKINFRPYIRVSEEFADWLEMMLEPVIEYRFSCAQEALAALQGEQALSRSTLSRRPKPKYSPITLTKTEERLVIKIPPVWFRTKHSRFFTLLLLVGTVNLGWPLTILNIFYSKLAELGYTINPPVLSIWIIGNQNLFALFISVGVLSGLLLFATLLTAASRISVEIDRDNFRLTWWSLSLCYGKMREKTEDINQVKLRRIGLPLKKNMIINCEIRCRLYSYGFGSLLTQQEKEWLVGEITAFMEKIR